ncbi:hypothetical protein VTI74DRAFT_1075 [Chaetomium olivicolor]
MNEGFCDLCKPLFHGAPEGDPGDSDDGYARLGYVRRIRTMKQGHRHHKNIHDLRNCGEKRCVLCAALWNSMTRSTRDMWLTWKKEILLDAQLVEERGQKSMALLMKSDGMGWNQATYFEPYNAAEETAQRRAVGLSLDYPLRPLGECDSTGSANSMRWAKAMLEYCALNHEECRHTFTPTVRLPTRLIHLGELGQPMSPRLVETSQLSPSLRGSIRYTTLSHCWGKAHTLRLTKESRSRFYNGIEPSSIPKTFADAMAITRSLGLEYIWIDSLCIIQGDKDDWERECVLMADVYRHGHCNIAAVASTDSHGGCFRPRDPTILNILVAESNWDGEGRALWVRSPYRKGSSLGYAIDDTLVHRRGWVVQERIMAPRILHFGEKMIYWECREGLGSEALGRATFPTSRTGLVGYMYDAASGSFKIPPENIFELLTRWAVTINRYTSAGLTFQSDKFMAISAVAREVQRMLKSSGHGTVEYLAGLWNVFLERQLLWRSPYPGITTRLSQTADGLTAPSWSWASLRGPVNMIFPSAHGTALLACVNRHTLVPRSGDPFFGPAANSQSTLEIRGRLWRLADWARDKDHPVPLKPKRGLSLLWDTAAASSGVKTATFLLPVAVYVPPVPGVLPVPHISGLVLQKADDSAAAATRFQRRGYFEFRLCGLEDQAQFHSLHQEGYIAWVNKIIEFCLEDMIIWPSHFNAPPGPTTTTCDIWAEVAGEQTIIIE